MMGYMAYFNVAESQEVIRSPYNKRQDSFADRVIRGKILDHSGNVLAQTSVAEDGSETREYPYGNMFAHVVGYADQGKSGIESLANFELLTSNAFFLEKIQKEFQGEKNVGDNVVTTLDADLQEAAYDALGSQKGAVVVMEPSTGKILAMVSKPDFSPGDVAENWDSLNSDENSALLNRATQGHYVPGSSFKLVTALEYMRENADYDSYSYFVVAYTNGEDGTLNSEQSNEVNVNNTSSVTSVANTADVMISGTEGAANVTLAHEAHINVYNVQGALVASTFGNEGLNRITLPSGIYVVKAGTTTAKVIVK